MAIDHFFNMAAVRHIGFVVRVFDHPRRALVVFIVVQNLVGIDTAPIFDNMHVLYFTSLA